MITHWYEITSLRTGLGQVEVFEVATEEEIAQITAQAKQPPYILGGGTNILGSDADCVIPVLRAKRGLPIEPISSEGTLLRCPAGRMLSAIIYECTQKELGGIAQLAGIPGTIGGAAAMNAGANGNSISSVIAALDGWDIANNCAWHWREGDGGFDYRKSPVPTSVMLLTVTLRLKHVGREMELSAIDAEKRRRMIANPQGPSAGSVFRNPPDAPAAGWLLEQAGCKGLKQGNLCVSTRHANWIMNLSEKPAATADALALIETMRMRVLAMSGITLELEWRQPTQRKQ